MLNSSDLRAERPFQILVSLTGGEKVRPVCLHCPETLLDNSNLGTEGLLQILVSLTHGVTVGLVSLHGSQTLLDTSDLGTEGLLQILILLLWTKTVALVVFNCKQTVLKARDIGKHSLLQFLYGGVERRLRVQGRQVSSLQCWHRAFQVVATTDTVLALLLCRPLHEPTSSLNPSDVFLQIGADCSDFPFLKSLLLDKGCEHSAMLTLRLPDLML